MSNSSTAAAAAAAAMLASSTAAAAAAAAMMIAVVAPVAAVLTQWPMAVPPQHCHGHHLLQALDAGELSLLVG